MVHHWGDLDNQGRDICDRIEEVAQYIGEWLRKYGRINVMQYKEKFGTIRVYCCLGWEGLYSMTHPGCFYIPRGIPRCTWISYINFLVVPIQKVLYRHRYKQAIKRWPDLKEEILCCADYKELLEGL